MLLVSERLVLLALGWAMAAWALHQGRGSKAEAGSSSALAEKGCLGTGAANHWEQSHESHIYSSNHHFGEFGLLVTCNAFLFNFPIKQVALSVHPLFIYLFGFFSSEEDRENIDFMRDRCSNAKGLGLTRKHLVQEIEPDPWMWAFIILSKCSISGVAH